MSTDFAEKEREFLATLEADTGRNLPAWMEAISAQNLTGKNEIIDWLRQQGFMFSKASWLERIHDNGGKPIYSDSPETKPVPDFEPAPVNAPDAQVAEPSRKPDLYVVPKSDPPPPVDSALEDLLIKAKALRPLAKHLLREIARAVPAATFAPDTNYVSIRSPGEFAVLTIGPKELKLGLALPGEPITAPLQAAKFAAPAHRISPAITHMTVLTDARQITGALLAAIAKAAALAGD